MEIKPYTWIKLPNTNGDGLTQVMQTEKGVVMKFMDSFPLGAAGGLTYIEGEKVENFLNAKPTE